MLFLEAEVNREARPSHNGAIGERVIWSAPAHSPLVWRGAVVHSNCREEEEEGGDLLWKLAVGRWVSSEVLQTLGTDLCYTMLYYTIPFSSCVVCGRIARNLF